MRHVRPNPPCSRGPIALAALTRNSRRAARGARVKTIVIDGVQPVALSNRRDHAPYEQISGRAFGDSTRMTSRTRSSPHPARQEPRRPG